MRHTKKPFSVYIKTDGNSRVISINSDAFLPEYEGWIKIDEGYGIRYHHAQGNYFEKPLVDDDGVYRYKLVDGAAVERTADEMEADRLSEAETSHTMETRVQKLEDSNAELTETVDMILSGVTADE